MDFADPQFPAVSTDPNEILSWRKKNLYTLKSLNEFFLFSYLTYGYGVFLSFFFLTIEY